MTNALDLMRETGTLSKMEFSNPFKKRCITAIHMHCYPNSNAYPPEQIVSASVEFERGMTKGEQKFRGKDFQSVLNQMYMFCSQL